jgi:type IV pilus biogenesis protein CpaD/CtpE
MTITMRTILVLPLLFIMATALVACDHNFDGVAKLNEVPFGGTNQANIAAMVANPADLVHGRGRDDIGGWTATAPIQRMQTDHDKKLLNTGHTETGGSGG